MFAAIADTSFVIAVSVKTEREHQRCKTIYYQHQTIALPQTTFAEVSYMLERIRGKELVIDFIRHLNESRYRILPLEPEDFLRAADILEKYADTRLDYIDATIAAVAERLEITTILTLDRRDFSPLRPAHIERFHLLPE
jgi:predicted nucleic acid-binding protein